MTEPGWYTDPRDSSQYRYWDGTSWTEAVAPGTAAETYSASATESVDEERAATSEDPASVADVAADDAGSAFDADDSSDAVDVVDQVSEQLGAVLGTTTDQAGDLAGGIPIDETFGRTVDNAAGGLSVDEALLDLDPSQRLGDSIPSAEVAGQGISVDDVLSEVESPFDDATETMVVDVPDFSEAPDLGEVGIPGDGVSFSSPIDYGAAGETAVISDVDFPSADAGTSAPSGLGEQYPPPPSPTPVGFDSVGEATAPTPALGDVDGTSLGPAFTAASVPPPEFGPPGGGVGDPPAGFDAPLSDQFGSPPRGPSGFDQDQVPYPDQPAPGQRPLAAPPAAPTKNRTPWIVLGILGLAVVAVLAFLAIRSPGRTSVDAITEGQCFANFDQFEATEIRSSVSGADCDGEHALEVFEVTDDPYRDFEEYPGEQVITDLAFRHCLDGFEGFVGTTYEASELDVWALYPTEGSWNLNSDREVVCMVGAYNQTLTTGTLQNSGR